METLQLETPHGDHTVARRYCNSTRKQSRGPCRNPAGFKTSHPGEGRCFLHGGNARIKHGRYSEIVRPRTAELMRQLSADPNPLDIMPEVHLVRGITIELVENAESTGDVTLLIHAARSASETTKMVERVWKFQQTRSVPFGLFAEFVNLYRTAVQARMTSEQEAAEQVAFERCFAQLAAKLDMRAGAQS